MIKWMVQSRGDKSMPVLKKGSIGPQVEALQRRLKELGFDPNGVDGDFGAGTQAAVIAFQNSKGLEADGKVGPSTLAALNLNGASDSTPVADTPNGGGNGAGLSKILNENDYKQAAEQLKCEVAAIKAVAQVESAGGGFLPDGRPKILFERHVFHEYTKGHFDAKHPDLSNPKQGGYGETGGKHQWDRFNLASTLDSAAAIKACSWGKFQAMGFNFGLCGFATLEDFHAAMLKNEGEHLKAFCNFITNSHLDAPLRSHNWVKFARGYNGKTFKKNKYDTKLAAAYKKFSK